MTPPESCPKHHYEAFVGCASCRADALASGDSAALAEWTARTQSRECDEKFPPHFRTAKVTHPEVTAWVDAYAKGATRSLLLLGPTGVGKTYTAYAALRAVVTGPRPGTWTATTAADMYAALRPRPKVDTEAEMHRMRGVAVLMVDDLGATKHSVWVEEQTYRVVDHRYVHARPMILTSNLPTAQLREAIGDRIASRLAETCTRVVLDGPDRRRTRTEVHADGIARLRTALTGREGS